MSEIIIKAISPFVAFTGEMRVFNVGDEKPLPADIAQTYLDSGQAELPGKKTAKPQLDRDGDGAAGGSKKGKESTSALGAARKRYKAAVKKNAGPRWGVEKIEEELAKFLAAKAEVRPVEGHAASVLVTVEDDKFVVNAPWIDAPEPFDTSEAAEARQAELRAKGPPDGWEPEADTDAPPSE